MTESITFTRESSLGSKARRLRTDQNLTQQELAEVVGVSQEEVDLFECGLPVPLDIRRRLLKELWARKASG
jgi:transcriptional regulator with XRE-family HTH domain